MLNSLSYFDIVLTFKDTSDIKVFKAYHKQFKKYFVLKLVNEKSSYPISNYNIEINHPNIVKCYSKCIVIYHGRIFLMFVLEYMNSGNFNNFREHIISNPTPIFISILEGINHLHSNNIVHGDLKPANILFSSEEGELVPKLSDYDSRFIDSNKIVLTPEYAPPEWRDGVSKQTDIWSFGCILYQYFLDKLPFGSKMVRLKMDRSKIETILNNIENSPLNGSFLSIEEPFRFIIYKCLKKNLNLRLNNINEILILLNYSPKNILKRIYYYKSYLLSVYKDEIRLDK